MNRLMKASLTLSFLAAAGPVAMQAQVVPGPHPAYRHALTDLRAARHYLSDSFAWEPVRKDDNAAIREIDAAMARIKQAAIDDGMSSNDRFPSDPGLSPHDRFRKANELLYSAHNDLQKAEDVPESRGLRGDALRHIDAAHNIVDRTEKTAKWE